MNTEEKSLMKINNNSIFSKIKNFLKKIFFKGKEHSRLPDENNLERIEENKKEEFLKYIKNIEDDTTKIMNIYNQYRLGKVKNEDLSYEEKKKICELYNEDIKNMKKSNKLKIQKISEYLKRNKKLSE